MRIARSSKAANVKYWENRFTALENNTYKKSEACIANISKQFDRAQRQIQKDLAFWYGRIAKNNDISYDAAKKLLTTNELKEFKWTVGEYIKYGQENALDGRWITELENASAKVHISRLQQIQTEMRQTVESLYTDYDGRLSSFLANTFESNYYQTAFELAKGTGVTTTLHALDKASVERILTKPWCADGKAFSDRIWTRKEDLLNTLNTSLTQNLITGKDPQKAINDIAKRFDVEKSAAGRLVMTESAALSSEARKQSLKDLGVEEFEFVATLDSKTSTLCRAMDGQHFKMTEYKVGENAPPLHCNCRSCTVPYFNDEFTVDEYRAARDEADEGYVKVPGNMTYKEWENQYISNSHDTEKKPASREYINIAEVKKINKSAGEQLEMIPSSHIDILNKHDTQIVFDKPEASNYNEVNRTIHLIDDISEQEAIHEIGHALEDSLNIWEDSDFLTIASKIAEGNQCYYDVDTFVKPIWRIDSPLLISEYQGRVYDFPGSILPDGTANIKALGDLFSEAYAYYISNPLELNRVNPELYEYLRKVLPK